MKLKRQAMLFLLFAFAMIAVLAMPVFADDEATAEVPETEQALPAEEEQVETGEEQNEPEVLAELAGEDRSAPEETEPAALRSAPEEGVGRWVYSGGYWYFLTEGHGYLTDGFYTISGSTYYFNSSGTMAVGWQQIMNR